MIDSLIEKTEKIKNIKNAHIFSYVPAASNNRREMQYSFVNPFFQTSSWIKPECLLSHSNIRSAQHWVVFHFVDMSSNNFKPDHAFKNANEFIH